MANRGRSSAIPWLYGLAGAALSGLTLCGCANFWDEVTSRDFEFKALFVKPNPLVVLAESNDGDARAKALHALREPIQYGGTQDEQDNVMKILTAAAVSERQPLCRLAAIDSLGRCKDPRAVQALKDAFYNAGSFVRAPGSGPNLTDGIYTSNAPPPDLVTRIQCQALVALGETGNPAAVELLVRVVKEPQGEGEQENQQAMDRRIAATRALAKFHDPQGTQVLVAVLEKEKDVALRDQAYESLQVSTGQKLPPDPKAWSALVQQSGEPEAPTTQPSPASTVQGSPSSRPSILPASFK